MNIIDLTKEYKDNIIKNQNLDRYRAAYPSLFDHYFTYWANPEYFFKNTISEEEVDTRLAIVKKVIPKIEKAFHKNKIILSQIELVLFVGQNTSNGHAILENDKSLVWIPIESYTTNFRAFIFIAHEIIHGLHYFQNNKFYFSNTEEKQNTGRQMITEGIATYLSKTFLKISDEQVFWADYTSSKEIKKWMKKCDISLKKIKEVALKSFDSENKKYYLFYANNPDDILNNRSGYYLGFKFIEWVIEEFQLKPIQLFALKRNEFEKKAIEFLKKD